MRRRRGFPLFVGMIVVLAGCGGDDDVTSPAAVDTTEVTLAPTTGTCCAPETTTAPSPPSVAVETVADVANVSGVVDLSVTDPSAGTDMVLASTLTGAIVQIELATGAVDDVLDLSSVISSGGERGLLNITTDPAGERLYANLTNPAGDTEVRSWPLVDGRPDGGPGDGVLHLTIEQPFGNHNGGNLEFGPDGALWIGTGDGGSADDPGGRAQDPSTLLGKLLRVVPDPAGGVLVPDDNPDHGGRAEIWAVGLRNPWRYSFDPATDELWVADVGQNAAEEVTRVPLRGDVPSLPDFGWDRVEGDRAFEGEAEVDDLVPVVVYGHDGDGGCSITGGVVYRGTQIPDLGGWYLFGDFCGGWLRAVPTDDADREPVELLADLGPAITFETLADGEVLVGTPDALVRLVPA